MTNAHNFFSPRSIAVVGATADQRKYAYRPLENLVKTGYRGALYAVNPGRAEILGIPCFPSVAELPQVPDLALIAVPAPAVAGVLRECGLSGIRNCIVVTAGFAEAGNIELQEELTAIAAEHGIALVGPNCVGMINFEERIAATSSMIFRGEVPDSGPAGLVSQSGGLGIALLKDCAYAGIGVCRYVSVGNEAGESVATMGELLLRDPQVRVVGMYVEVLRDAQEFLRLGALARELDKSVVVLKVGRSPRGKLAAASHTGSILGKGDVASAILRRAGIVVVDTLEQFIDAIHAQSTNDWSAVHAVSVMSASGGMSVIAADACYASGLGLAELSPRTIAAVVAALPATASIRQNPIDIGPITDIDQVMDAGRIILDDSATEGLLLVFGPEDVGRYSTQLSEIGRYGTTRGKPVAVALRSIVGAHEVRPEARGELRAAGVAILENPGRAIEAISRLALRERDHRVLDAADDRAEPSSPARAAWDIERTLETIEPYGVTVAPYRFVEDPQDVSAAAAELGYPVVLKLEIEGVHHKTEVGTVALDVGDEKALGVALDRLLAAGRSRPGSRIIGTLVQSMVPQGIELIFGAVRDPEFGALVSVGGGGVTAELYEDVAFGVAPLSAADAERMLAETRVNTLLRGHRGKPAASVPSVVEALVRFSEVFAHETGIAELELNPVIASAEGCVAVDALALVGPEGASAVLAGVGGQGIADNGKAEHGLSLHG